MLSEVEAALWPFPAPGFPGDVWRLEWKSREQMLRCGVHTNSSACLTETLGVFLGAQGTELASPGILYRPLPAPEHLTKHLSSCQTTWTSSNPQTSCNTIHWCSVFLGYKLEHKNTHYDKCSSCYHTVHAITKYVLSEIDAIASKHTCNHKQNIHYHSLPYHTVHAITKYTLSQSTHYHKVHTITEYTQSQSSCYYKVHAITNKLQLRYPDLNLVK